VCAETRAFESGAVFALAGSAKEIDRSRWRADLRRPSWGGIPAPHAGRGAPLKGRRKPAVGSSAMKVGLRVVRPSHGELRIVDVVRKG
jgi:hypothetical protein